MILQTTVTPAMLMLYFHLSSQVLAQPPAPLQKVHPGFGSWLMMDEASPGPMNIPPTARTAKIRDHLVVVQFDMIWNDYLIIIIIRLSCLRLVPKIESNKNQNELFAFPS